MSLEVARHQICTATDRVPRAECCFHLALNPAKTISQRTLLCQCDSFGGLASQHFCGPFRLRSIYVEGNARVPSVGGTPLWQTNAVLRVLYDRLSAGGKTGFMV